MKKLVKQLLKEHPDATKSELTDTELIAIIWTLTNQRGAHCDEVIAYKIKAFTLGYLTIEDAIGYIVEENLW